MKRNSSRKESGMILIIVIMVVMVMSVVVMGVLSRNVTKSVSSAEEVKRIQAELLSKGAWWKAHASYQNAAQPPNFTETIDGQTYNITFSNSGNSGPGGTSKINTKVAY